MLLTSLLTEQINVDNKTPAAVRTDSLGWQIWLYLQRLVAILMLLLSAPLFLVLAVIVKADSRGPFLYSQQRPGKYGVPFKAYKIRSMTVGADKDTRLALATTSDCAQITRVGAILRELKLDELPQLFNIARGDMVFVGPRPIAKPLHDKLSQHIPGFTRRLELTPGLTSLGQVCIEENDSVERVVQDWTVRFEGELHHLLNRSVTYDLVIIAMTAVYCLRKIFKRAPAFPNLRYRATGMITVLLIGAVTLNGCAPAIAAHTLEQAENGVSRAIPFPDGKLASSITEREMISVDTIPRGSSDPVYRLGHGDRLSINIFGEPGMEALSIQVDGSGEIQVPMIERIAAEGFSLAELQERLIEEYTAFFENPWVIVQLEAPLSRPLYLLGEFNQPGVVHMHKDTNLIQAIGEGRGLSGGAYIKGARLIREEQIAAVDIHALLNDGALDQNVWLKPNDTIFIPSLEDLRIHVLGAVGSPGFLEVTNGPLTLTDAIARAGGSRRGEANLEQVRVIRTYSPTAGELIVVDMKRILDGEAMDMPLEPGDIVYLPLNNLGTWNDVIAAISTSVGVISQALEPFVLARAISNN